MTVPYTYLLRHIPTNSFYYGCRYSEGCHPSEFWRLYKTSSLKVKKLIAEFGESSFVFEIRKIFSNAQSCRIWEHKVLRRLGVVRRKDFLNKTDNIAFSAEAATKGREIGNKTLSEKKLLHITAIGKANLGKRYSDEINKKKGRRGNQNSLGHKDTEETRLKKRNSKLGKPSNAIGNYQPRCSCVCCKREVTSGTLANHYRLSCNAMSVASN